MNEPRAEISANAARGVLSVPSYFLYGESQAKPVYRFFHIETLDVRNVPNEWRIRSHLHPDFDQISVLFSGGCRYEHDGQAFEIDGPSCVYTPDNVVHQFEYEPSAIGFVISVSPDFVQGLPALEGSVNLAANRISTRRRVLLSSPTAILACSRLCDILAEKMEAYHTHRRDLLRYHFAALLLELDACLETDNADAAERRPDACAAALFARYSDLVQSEIGSLGYSNEMKIATSTVELFADRLSTTPYALNMACQLMAGTNARSLIQSAAIDQATRLLLYTGRSVKEVSYFLGYSHASHFVRFFKQKRGMTPDAFRRHFGGDTV